MDGSEINGAGGEYLEEEWADAAAASNAAAADASQEGGVATIATLQPYALEPLQPSQDVIAASGQPQPSSNEIDGALLASLLGSQQTDYTSLQQRQTQQSALQPAGASAMMQGQHSPYDTSLLSGYHGHDLPPSIAPAPAVAPTGIGSELPDLSSLGYASQAAASAPSPLASLLQPSQLGLSTSIAPAPFASMASMGLASEMPNLSSLGYTSQTVASAPLPSVLPSGGPSLSYPGGASQASASAPQLSGMPPGQAMLPYQNPFLSPPAAMSGSWMALQAASSSQMQHPYGTGLDPASASTGDNAGTASGGFSLPSGAGASTSLPLASTAGASTSLPFASETTAFASFPLESAATSSSGSVQAPSSVAASSLSTVPSAPRGSTGRVTRLAIPSDDGFLDPAHAFLRSQCLEAFESTQEDLMSGRGTRANSKVGQVGLRCAFCAALPRRETARQAVCYPSKRETIYEAVRNYHRTHLPECPCIPEATKAQFKRMMETSSDRHPQRVIKAYYAEAAADLGIVEGSKGLVFGEPPTSIPSEGVRAIIRAASGNDSEYWQNYEAKTRSTQLRKFEHLASEATKRVLLDARREESVFVRPEDFPTVGDVEYLLFSQLDPCRPSSVVLKRRRLEPKDAASIWGLRCKHCANDPDSQGRHKGMWFPLDFRSLTDSSFAQSVTVHMQNCDSVPREVKDAFDELRRLAAEHKVITKRGSKRKFLEKVWNRLKSYTG
ncbi:hypothetical protein ACHAXT_007944 [Thalassiosira profunda]